MFKNILAFFLATILALGCGGGGGGGSTMPRRPAILPQIPLQTPVHAPQAPIVNLDGSLHVGAKVAPEINQLSITGARGEVSISSGSVRDGAGRDALVEFLKPFVEVGPSKSIAGLPTYSSPPVVRAARGTSAEHMDYAVRAVQIINAYLPRDKRISFSSNPSPPRVGTDEVPPGEIFIDFAPHREWNPPSTRPVGQEPRGTTRSGSIYYEYPETGETTYGGVEHSRIWINSDKIREFSGEAMILLLAHELLHALGFRGHPDPVRYHDSVTRSRVPRVFSERILGPVDPDAILAIYTGYEPGDTSVESLGPWSDTSFHLRGDLRVRISSVSFGVASRNGLAQPWASGPTPSVNMVDNEELSGNRDLERRAPGHHEFGGNGRRAIPGLQSIWRTSTGNSISPICCLTAAERGGMAILVIRSRCAATLSFRPAVMPVKSPARSSGLGMRAWAVCLSAMT